MLSESLPTWPKHTYRWALYSSGCIGIGMKPCVVTGLPKIPLRHPRQRAPQAHVAEQMALNLDILPTFASMAGIALVTPVDGLDLSDAIHGDVVLRFPKASGLAAALIMLPTAQRVAIGLAGQRVSDVGVPVRTTKITRSE